MIFGYARVSTDDQNLSLQIDALTHYGIDKLFQEKVTGAKKDRPQLEEMINLWYTENVQKTVLII